MISRASFGIVSSIGALLLLAIWPNILPLQQHLAMAQIIPGSVRAPPYGSAPANTTAAHAANTTAGAPANTTAGAPANTTAAHAANTTAGAPANTTAAHAANTTAGTSEAPVAFPAGLPVVPHWYGGAPCEHCH